MLYLALTCGNGSRTVVAARNVHRSFVYAAALLDFEIVWLWPECSTSLCGCPVSAETLERTLATLPAPPAAVYLTSPDYLGSVADISALAEVCRKHGTLLAVDNAHGAYLRFLEPSCHPLDLGADLCCDSAHKTLPVLTGGAYLHISRAAPVSLRENAKTAMAMFGSTSPSYLTLASLDLCNRYLAEGTVSVGNVEHRLSPEQAQAHLQHLSRLMRENPDFDIWLIRDTTMLSDAVRRAPSLFIDTISVYIENARPDAHGNFHISMDPRMREAFQVSFERMLRQPYCTKLTPEDLLRYL